MARGRVYLGGGGGGGHSGWLAACIGTGYCMASHGMAWHGIDVARACGLIRY